MFRTNRSVWLKSRVLKHVTVQDRVLACTADLKCCSVVFIEKGTRAESLGGALRPFTRLYGFPTIFMVFDRLAFLFDPNR